MNSESSSAGVAGNATSVAATQLSDRALIPEDAVLCSRHAPNLTGENSWRQEVATRLNRYQARRKPRPPRYPSLRLRFDAENAHNIHADSLQSNDVEADHVAQPRCEITRTETQSAVSESGLREVAVAFAASGESIGVRQASIPHAQESVPAESFTAKVIEFPRFWTPPEPPPDQLAEPVCERPRILDVPEIEPPPPALGGIIIEPAPVPEKERRPGIDVPLQTAPMERRVLSAAIDAIIVLVACSLFGLVFCQMTTFCPPPMQTFTGSAALFGVFWAAYQYLLLVYSGSTPGIHLAKLRLANFNGSSTTRTLRRWRVLASFLSAASLGLGFAWSFVDEDSLCWHDRITQTHLAP